MYLPLLFSIALIAPVAPFTNMDLAPFTNMD